MKAELAVISRYPARYVGIVRQNRSTQTRSKRCLGTVVGLVLTSLSFADDLATMRYVRLDSTGKVLSDGATSVTATCIEDRNTGLTWELKSNDAGLRDARHTYSWHAVPRHLTVARCETTECNVPAYIAAANAAGLCGARNWRLPAREELRSIVDYARVYPGPTINTAVFNSTSAHFYWSANEDAGDRRNAWGIGFAFGFDYAYPKENAAHVRLVRRSRNPARAPFEILADGSVRDGEHGLVWQRCSSGQLWNGTICTGSATRLTFAEAQTRSQIPWRLPTLTELTRLVDTTRTAPAIDHATFPNTEMTSYWSDTPLAGRPPMMWLVNFMYGDSYADAADERAAVRWVRDAE